MFKVFIIATIAANTVPRWIPSIDGDLFCMWQAISFVLMGFALLFMKNTNNYEVLFAIIITLWTVYRLIKCQSKHKATT